MDVLSRAAAIEGLAEIYDLEEAREALNIAAATGIFADELFIRGGQVKVYVRPAADGFTITWN